MTDTTTTELAKTFDPAAIEAKWYAHWEASGAFRPDRPEDRDRLLAALQLGLIGAVHILLEPLRSLLVPVVQTS